MVESVGSTAEPAAERDVPAVSHDGLPSPESAADARSLVWRKLESQFHWYSDAASRSRIGYLLSRVVALVVGAAVTVLAAADAPPALTASLAALVVAVEGVQQLFQFHTNWLSYRGAAESLRRHGFMFAAGLPPYQDPATRQGLLAEVITNTTSREHNAWREAMERPSSAPA